MRFSKMVVPVVIACSFASPVGAQYRIVHTPLGFGSSGSPGRDFPYEPRVNGYERLAAFGRCIVERDYANSMALALAYHRGVGERDVVDRLRPVLTACRLRTHAGRLAYGKTIRMAAIADALRERRRTGSNQAGVVSG